MKLPFSKREWLGSVLLLVGVGALGLLLFQLSLVVGWVRADYTGPIISKEFWRWLHDPNNRSKLEPPASLFGILASFGFSLASFIFAALRKKDDAPTEPITAALHSRVVDWHIIRPLLITTVRSQNVTGYEEGSIFEGVRIALGAVKAPEALDRPQHVVVGSTGKELKLHKNGSAILKLFTESAGTLLIQGEPGSGKSYTLHQLAARLLDVAEKKADAPVPVVVPLASWAMKKLPLDQWLAVELSLHYRLSAKDTPLLLAEGGRLALLLDGLDEVTESVRAECLVAIQKFMAGFRAPVAICCRAQEFQELNTKLLHGESIRLLPLTPQQVDDYLAEFDALTPLRDLLKTDGHWASLATTPLMLGIMARVYAAGGSVPGGDATQEQKRDALLDFYVREMFARKARIAAGKHVPEEAHFTPAQAIYWLQQLAGKLGAAPTFYIERMQPGWARRWRYALIVGLIVALLVGLIVGLLGSVMFGAVLGPIAGVIAAANTGLIACLFGLSSDSVEVVETVRLRWQGKEFVAALIVGLVGGLVGGQIGGLVGGLSGGLKMGLISGPIAGVILGLFERRSFPEPQTPNQGVRHSAMNSLFYGAGFAAFGLAIGFTVAQTECGTMTGLWLGLSFFGGGAVIKHYAIRLALAWEGTLPHPLSDRKLIAFLDAMRDRMLLRRPAGKGGWDFIHRELQEFLARCPYGRTAAEVEATLRARPAR